MFTPIYTQSGSQHGKEGAHPFQCAILFGVFYTAVPTFWLAEAHTSSIKNCLNINIHYVIWSLVLVAQNV
jgi:hypothetical protein